MTLPEPNGSFKWVQVAPVGPALVCQPLEPVARHFFTTRASRLGTASFPAPAGVDPGWDDVSQAMGIEPSRLVRAHQVHGRAVLIHHAGHAASLPPPDADIIVSADPSVVLAVQTADCVPLLVADRRTRAAAAAHAGWRGLADRVPVVCVEALAREFGSRPADLIVAAGPAVGPCCYQVGVDVRQRFEAAFSPADIDRWFHRLPQPTSSNPSMPGLTAGRAPGRWFFDAWRATRDQLEAAGVPADQIYGAGLCTASHVILCSYRRDGGEAGRMAGAISGPLLRP